MKLLLLCATDAEITPLLQHIQQKWLRIGDNSFRRWDTVMDICIAGVGQVATTYALTRRLQHHNYDLAIQVGIGGSFDEKIGLGEVVFITKETYGDLGAEDHAELLDIFDMGLLAKDTHPHANGRLVNPINNLPCKVPLPKVSGLTVNMVSGNEATIAHRAQRYGCQVESMEGAAFHYVCLQEGVPFAQIRSISNYVTPRDKSKWKMKEAIINLNNWLINFLEGM